MSLDIIWLNAYGGTSIILVLMVSIIYYLRSIGTKAFTILSILFLLNFTIYLISTLFEINSYYHNNTVGLWTYLSRFLSLVITGPIFYLGVLERLGGFYLLKKGKERVITISSILFIGLFITYELNTTVPFSFISDKYNLTYITILKRILLLSYTISVSIYTFFKFIKPSLKIENSLFNKEMISIFQGRFMGILITFLPMLLISILPITSSYWATILMLLYSTMIYMQFLSNATRHSKNNFHEMPSSSENLKKKEKMIIDNGEAVLEKLMNAIEQDKLYLDCNISLTKLSSYIKCPSHIVSIVINNTCKMSFIQLINSYRVEAAKDLLLKNDESTSISSIALEVGFNSVSTFNRAFKKIEGVTPSHFQKLNKIGDLRVSYS